METQRNISLVNVAQLVILSAISPAMADTFDEETKAHRHHHQHGYVQPVSHSRADYPVIWSWLSSPDDNVDPSNTAK